MEASRQERAEQLLTMEGYKKKMYDNVTDRCEEMFEALDKLRAEMALSRSSINRQNGFNA